MAVRRNLSERVGLSRRCLHLHLFRTTYESYVRAVCSKCLMIVRSLLAWAALQDSAASQFNQSWRSRSPPKTQSPTKWSPGRSVIQESEESHRSAVIRRNTTTRQSTAAVAVQKCLADRCHTACCQGIRNQVFKPPIHAAVDDQRI